LHPEIYEYVITYLKKAQRKIDILELKQNAKPEQRKDEPID
jgi:hypothetical protein